MQSLGEKIDEKDYILKPGSYKLLVTSLRIKRKTKERRRHMGMQHGYMHGQKNLFLCTPLHTHIHKVS